tara:strand:+ start:641 stop:1027 length:387 start_codon:yes stop_codon:yes gene_type:complete
LSEEAELEGENGQFRHGQAFRKRAMNVEKKEARVNTRARKELNPSRLELSPLDSTQAKQGSTAEQGQQHGRWLRNSDHFHRKVCRGTWNGGQSPISGTVGNPDIITTRPNHWGVSQERAYLLTAPEST